MLRLQDQAFSGAWRQLAVGAFVCVLSGCSGELAADGSTDGSGAAAADGAGTGGTTGASGGSPSSAGSGGTSQVECGTSEVRAVFAQSCTGSLCHDASTPAANLDLTVFDPAAALSGVPGTLCSDSLLVDPGSPSTSLLLTKVSDTIPSCGEKMPIGATLDGASVNCIASWITRLATDPPTCESCGGSTCTDLNVDASNCGECGHDCASGEICVDAACKGCPEGETSCGTRCVDVTSSVEHCGSCGTTCGAGQTCVEGECACEGGASVSFSADVAPLLEVGCTNRGCHGGAMPKEGLDLRATVSFAELVGVGAGQCQDGRLLVDPGAPERSYLVQKLLGMDLCSGSLMPKGAMPLTAAELATISAWICGGALDN